MSARDPDLDPSLFRVQIGPAFVASTRSWQSPKRGAVAGPDGSRVVDVEITSFDDQGFARGMLAACGLRRACAGKHVARVHTIGRNSTLGLVCIQDAPLGVSLNALVVRLTRDVGDLPLGHAVALVRAMATVLHDVDRALHLGRSFASTQGSDWILCWDGVLRTRLMSTLAERRMTLISPGIMRGTFWQMSREVAMGNPADARSDVYALGCVLYWLLSTTKPFQGTSAIDELRAAVEGVHAPLSRYRPDLSPAATALVSSCMSREQEQRPASFTELIAALDALQERSSEHELAAFVRALFPDKHRADEALIEEVALLALPPPDLESSTVLVAAEGDADAAREQEQNGELPFAFRDDDDPFDDVDTRPELTLEAWGRDGRPMVHVSGVGPAFFLDTAPVTRGEFARYLEETGAAPLDAAAGDDMDHAPMTSVSREQALAYAAWAGKRLPTSPEWDAALAREDEVAPAQRVLFAPIWQWTNTGFASAGFVVRGGAYRDQPREIPRPENVAFEDRAANDVGFRCAADVDAPGIVRALR